VIVRFEWQQRMQHLLMMSTFLLLAFTGLPQKFHDWEVAQWWVAILGGIDNIRNVHHLAAWGMAFACLWHLLWLGYGILIKRKPFPTWMLPQSKDFVDFMGEIRYWFGFSRSRPKFDRFNWREKFDYWAVFWGIPVIGLSGLVMMYPVLATQFLPGWAIPVSYVAHSDEALLAVGWIFVVHFFNAHLAPGIFPFNSSIFTGRVPLRRYREEHPLEFQRIMGLDEEPEGEEGGEPTRPEDEGPGYTIG